MRISSIIAGASAAMVAFQAACYAARGEAFLLRPPGAHGESDFSARCVKCGKCIEACPYGVRTLQEGEPVYYSDFAFGGEGAPAHVAGTVEKCTFCAHRVEKGERPFCVEVCPARARTFGDLDDPDSDLSKLIAARDCEQLSVDAGTGPSVYLLV